MINIHRLIIFLLITVSLGSFIKDECEFTNSTVVMRCNKLPNMTCIFYDNNKLTMYDMQYEKTLICYNNDNPIKTFKCNGPYIISTNTHYYYMCDNNGIIYWYNVNRVVPKNNIFTKTILISIIAIFGVCFMVGFISGYSCKSNEKKIKITIISISLFLICIVIGFAIGYIINFKDKINI